MYHRSIKLKNVHSLSAWGQKAVFHIVRSDLSHNDSGLRENKIKIS